MEPTYQILDLWRPTVLGCLTGRLNYPESAQHNQLIRTSPVLEIRPAITTECWVTFTESGSCYVLGVPHPELSSEEAQHWIFQQCRKKETLQWEILPLPQGQHDQFGLDKPL